MQREDQLNGDIEKITPLLVELQSNLAGRLNLDNLAERYGYSRYHFHRWFTKIVGETPRRYVERLRMEKAAYKLWITDQSVLDIALSVGFKNHETFSRACRRHFATSPRELRDTGRFRKRKVIANHRWNPTGCVLSPVRFELLRPMTLLAIRHVGGYGKIPEPLSPNDKLWTRILAWAEEHRVRCQPIALCLYHDNPWLTPESAQHADACLPVIGPVKGTRSIRSIQFEGGEFATIDHTGPLSTRWQAFRKVADTVHASPVYAFPGEPNGAISIKPLTREGLSHTQVCLRVLKKK